MPQWIKDLVKFAPAIWMGVKVLWQLYKAKIKQEGFREALKQQKQLRIEAERQLDLERRRNLPDDERLRTALDAERKRRDG